MAKIHWLVYIIVGIFVSIFSWKTDFEKLMLFFYLGLLFILIGIVKLVFVIGKGRHKEEKTHHKAGQQHKGKYCHSCGSQIELHHKFCTKCGAKL
jgi:chromate transport protein ChrA